MTMKQKGAKLGRPNKNAGAINVTREVFGTGTDKTLMEHYYMTLGIHRLLDAGCTSKKEGLNQTYKILEKTIPCMVRSENGVKNFNWTIAAEIGRWYVAFPKDTILVIIDYLRACTGTPSKQIAASMRKIRLHRQ